MPTGIRKCFANAGVAAMQRSSSGMSFHYVKPYEGLPLGFGFWDFFGIWGWGFGILVRPPGFDPIESYPCVNDAQNEGKQGHGYSAVLEFDCKTAAVRFAFQ
jgi:hypothetical protein